MSLYELFGRSRAEVLREQDIRQAKLMSKRALVSDRHALRSAQSALEVAVREYESAVRVWLDNGEGDGADYAHAMEAYHNLSVAQGAANDREQLLSWSYERESKLRRYA